MACSILSGEKSITRSVIKESKMRSPGILKIEPILNGIIDSVDIFRKGHGSVKGLVIFHKARLVKKGSDINMFSHSKQDK